jgi:hypothetical protein
MSINTPAPAGPLPAGPPYPGRAPATAHDLERGHGRPADDTAAATLTVADDDAPRARLDAVRTRLRLRALHVMGHNSVRIARALDVSQTTIKDLVRGDARTVSPELRDAVADLYDAWWDKRAPARARSERAAATLARRRAIAGNWCAGAALDDDQLDTPGYRPAGAGNRPPAPVLLPISTRPHSGRKGAAHARRRTPDLGV